VWTDFLKGVSVGRREPHPVYHGRCHKSHTPFIMDDVTETVDSKLAPVRLMYTKERKKYEVHERHPTCLGFSSVFFEHIDFFLAIFFAICWP